MADEQGDTRVIVVGIDGSDGSERALAWAIDEARLRRDTVRAVTAWSVPVIVAGSGMAPVVLPDDEFQEGARSTLDRTVDAAIAGAQGELPPIERVLARGPAATVLLEAAEGADLLVVGTRGRGGFTGLLLGSVSQQCAHHAQCPVVVVPHRSDDT